MAYEIIFETLGQLVEELDKDEILDLLIKYDRYIMNFYENHDSSCQPACILEYFNNDYMNMINELYE